MGGGRLLAGLSVRPVGLILGWESIGLTWNLLDGLFQFDCEITIGDQAGAGQGVPKSFLQG